MVNEIAEGNKNEAEPWTIRLGKHVLYNPSPIVDRDDFARKTLATLLILALGVYLLYVPGIQILGALVVGSMIFLYVLSLYEMRLLDKQNRQKLR
jgi:hypothetical protein